METKRNSKLAVVLVLGLLMLSVVFGNEKFQSLVREKLGWGQEGQKPEEAPIIKPGEETGIFRVAFITDTHLLADSLHDNGTAFQEMMANDDGKITPYVPQVLEAFAEEIVANRPDAVVLSGDLTLNGEKASHEQLASILHKLQEQGVQVLVIPGNHDINNHAATAFWGEERTGAEPVTPQGFFEIYQEFGYNQALNRDPASLSYVYALGERIWLMMLDTNVYEPVNQVHGEIKPETYEWIKQQLEQADAHGAEVVAVGHHNLLPESRLYTQACTIEGRKTAVEIFAQHQVPLYVSGHLHASRAKKNKTEPGMLEDAYGIYERVNSALCVPPCQYGVLTWPVEGSWSYEVKPVDVEGWAARHGRTEKELLHFQEYSKEVFFQIIGGQVKERVVDGLTEEIAEKMAWTYADLLYRYGAGQPVEKRELRTTEGYQLWERFRPDHEYMEEMEEILGDL